MFSSFTLQQLIPLFIMAAAVVWLAGNQLSYTTDIIDERFGLGDALGGLIFLAIATNLPEIAIVLSASLARHPGIAIGNILGGIAIQTVVLAVLDAFGLGSKVALTYQAASLQLVLEGILVICVLVLSIMGSQLPQSFVFARLAPSDLIIVTIWLIGLWLLSKARRNLPWHKKDSASYASPPSQKHKQVKLKKRNTIHVLLVFVLASVLTLIAGVVLEESGRAIAADIGWSGVLFGSTILAAATALPEVSTGLAAVRIGNYTLAFSDILGGNAFLPTLFLLATLCSGEATLPKAQSTDIYLAGLGVLLTAIYMCGLIFRSKRQFLVLGIDSVVVVLVYLIGMVGLFAIS